MCISIMRSEERGNASGRDVVGYVCRMRSERNQKQATNRMSHKEVQGAALLIILFPLLFACASSRQLNKLYGRVRDLGTSFNEFL